MNDNTKRFALIGVAGYIAPRHLKAIKDTGNQLVAAVDPNDSVGILDQFFPDAQFFTEIERFDRHLEKLRRKSSETAVNYLTVCSPNYLHDSHVRLGLRVHADVICEKPLVVNPWNLDQLSELEAEFGHRVYSILQLRLHPALLALKQKLDADHTRRHQVQLSYVTPRGRWYDVSWKGVEDKSGGIAMNIGVHFFDMLVWFFGSAERVEVHQRTVQKMAGALEFERASVAWYLSLDHNDLPEKSRATNTPFRSITIDGEEVQFSAGFTDLHTRAYEEIVAGRGFGINDARPSIQLVYDVRHSELVAGKHVHPMLKR